jgi:hypothetical protein
MQKYFIKRGVIASRQAIYDRTDVHLRIVYAKRLVTTYGVI